MRGANDMSSAGRLMAVATQDRGLNAEELADMALNKIVSVADTAPAPIRDQAMAFRGRVRGVLVRYLAQAAQSERATIAAELRRAGFGAMADVVMGR